MLEYRCKFIVCPVMGFPPHDLVEVALRVRNSRIECGWLLFPIGTTRRAQRQKQFAYFVGRRMDAFKVARFETPMLKTLVEKVAFEGARTVNIELQPEMFGNPEQLAVRRIDELVVFDDYTKPIARRLKRRDHVIEPKQIGPVQWEVVSLLQRPADADGIANGNDIGDAQAQLIKYGLPERQQPRKTGILEGEDPITALLTQRGYCLCPQCVELLELDPAEVDRRQRMPFRACGRENAFVDIDDIEILEKPLVVFAGYRVAKVVAELCTHRIHRADDDARSTTVHAQHDDQRRCVSQGSRRRNS
ncbi:hypothetical protein [Trinickia symbiotica]|uniref:hypothetical protein n=1 Tax=Trinickia symbiotica TaxID=863227 RepID=UPI0011AFBFC5|nr:hypothetical protein [Trinickia symbiotica]